MSEYERSSADLPLESEDNLGSVVADGGAGVTVFNTEFTKTWDDNRAWQIGSGYSAKNPAEALYRQKDGSWAKTSDVTEAEIAAQRNRKENL